MKTLPCTCGSEDYAMKCKEVNGEIVFDITCHKCGKSVFAHKRSRNEAMLSAVEQWNDGRDPMTYDQRIIAFLAAKLAAISGNINDKPVTTEDIIAWAEKNVKK